MVRGRPPGAREIAMAVLNGVERGEKPGDLLDELLDRHVVSPRDRALATEISYGTLRRQNTIDWILGSVLRTPLGDLTPSIRNLLRTGAYQILYLDRVPARAAVFESVEIARKRGHEGTARLVNGVLRSVDRKKGSIESLDPSADPIDSLAIRLSHPRWLTERWCQRLGYAETERLMEENLKVPPLTVRANTLRGGSAYVAQRLDEEGIAAKPGRYWREALNLEGHPPLRQIGCFKEGLFLVQDESSMLVAAALNPKPGEMVIDACSAPGGKATHLAELMHDQGCVLAVDTSETRVSMIEENARRLGIGCITTLTEDARALGDLFRGRADRVLVDAPCSGLGVVRRNPDAKWAKSPRHIDALAKIQVEILEGVSHSVKTGGILVYSVCTFEPEETQGVIRAFLEANPQFVLEDLDELLPIKLRGQGGREGMIALYPHRHGIDGFFVARMRLEGQE